MSLFNIVQNFLHTLALIVLGKDAKIESYVQITKETGSILSRVSVSDQGMVIRAGGSTPDEIFQGIYEAVSKAKNQQGGKKTGAVPKATVDYVEKEACGLLETVGVETFNRAALMLIAEANENKGNTTMILYSLTTPAGVISLRVLASDEASVSSLTELARNPGFSLENVSEAKAKEKAEKKAEATEKARVAAEKAAIRYEKLRREQEAKHEETEQETERKQEAA